MKNIELNNWNVNNNKASIALPHLHAKFNVLKNNDFVYFQLIITDSNMQTITINFYTLEDAFFFTEDIVSKCETNEEVITRYRQMFENGEFRLPGGLKPPVKEKITLTPDEVDEAIIGYFGEGKDYRVSVRNEMSEDFYGNPKIKFYLIEHLDYYGIKKDVEHLLTDGDLKIALANYVDYYGYDLDNFKYMGDIHRNEYYYDEDTSHYKGIELKVTHREESKEMIKS